ncbi:MAG: tetratricopeptide repeat protein [Lentisphaeria bacterium]
MTQSRRTTCRYARQLAAVTLLTAICALPARAQDECLRKFYLWSNAIVNGVPVRADSGAQLYFVSTDVGIVRLRFKDVRITGSMFQETHDVSQLLNIVDRNIKEQEFSRATRNTEDLKVAVAKFKLAVQPFLPARLEAQKRQSRALYNAIEYYEAMITAVPNTIAVVELQKHVDDLVLDLVNGREPYNSSSLTKLIRFQRDLIQIEGDTPLVRHDRAEVAEILRREQQLCVETLHEQALEQLQTTSLTDRAESYLLGIKGGTGAGDLYHEDLATFLTQVYEIVDGRLGRMMPAIEDLLQAEIDLPQQTYEQTQRSVRSIESFLGKARLQMFGPDIVKLDRALDEQLQKIHDHRAAADTRHSEILTIQRFLRNGNRALMQKRYRDAIVELSKVLDATNHADTQARANAGILQATEARMTMQLATLVANTPAQNRQLLERAQRFLAENHDALVAAEYRLDVIESDIRMVAGYATFQERFAVVLKGNAVEQWNRYTALDRWLLDNRGRVHSAAYSQWADFLEQHRFALFTHASSMFSNNISLLTGGDQNTLVSLLEYCLSDGRLQRADELLQFGFEHLSPDDSRSLFSLQRQLAQAYALKGQSAQAFDCYNQLMELDETLRHDNTLQRQVAQLKLRLANQKAATGMPEEAIEQLETLAITAPMFARDQRVRERIVELRLQLLPDDLDSDSRLEIFDDLCRDYPGAAGRVSRINATGGEIVADFEAIWQQSEFIRAIVKVSELQSQYANLSKEIDIESSIVPIVRQTVRQYDWDNQQGRQVSFVFVEALQLFVSRFANISENESFDDILVKWKIALAESFNETGQSLKADAIYANVLINFPIVAADYSLEERRRELSRKVRLARIQRPLGIKTDLDWLLFGVTIIIWLSTYIVAHRSGRERGHLNYRLLQFAAVFAAFLAILVPCLMSNVDFTTAFVRATVIPGVLFYGIGFSTYLFFPLIYGERRLVLERRLLQVLGGTRDSRPIVPHSFTGRLSANIARLEKDLPLLHNRLLYRISKARELANSKPERGYQEFERLLKRLDKELVKTTEDWQSNYAECLCQLGRLAVGLGHAADALHYLNRHLGLNPKHIDTRLLLGDLLFESHDYEGAIAHIKACLAARGGTPDLWSKLGRCFFETGKYVSAYKCFDSIPDKDRDSLFWSARSYARADEIDKAVDNFQQLLKRKPNDSEAMYFLASSLAAHGAMDKAGKIAGLIKEDDGFYSRALALQGNIKYLANDLQAAKEKFKQALGIDANCIPAFVGMGQLAFEGDEKDKAATIFDQILLTESDNFSANYYRGLLHEGKNDAKAIVHLERAARLGTLSVPAHMALGRIYAMAEDNGKALEHYGTIESIDLLSPWDLWFYTRALAAQRRLDRCRDIITHLVNPTSVDTAWSDIAQRALYSLGLFLIDHSAYDCARQCLEFVVSSAIDPVQKQRLRRLIEESQLRHMVNLAASGNCGEAQSVLAELQAQSDDPQCQLLCQFYIAMTHLHQGSYEKALAALDTLRGREQDNSRYQYHAIVAELGLGHDTAVQSMMQQLTAMPDLTPHLKVGMATITAYLAGRQGDYDKAVHELDALFDYGNYTGAAFVNQQVSLNQAFYLCHLRDFNRIAELMGELPTDSRAGVAYLQAIALIAEGKNDLAKAALAPYLSDHQSRGSKLFSILSTELALAAVGKRDLAGARHIFQQIPAPAPEVKTVIMALSLSEVLDHADDPTAIRQAILELKKRLDGMEDKDLAHSLLHNLSVLHYQLASVLEVEQAVDETFDAWNECLNFWEENIFTNPRFWNRENLRFAAPDETVTRFNDDEIIAINNQFKLENFVNRFVEYTLEKIKASDEPGLERYLSLLAAASENRSESLAILGRHYNAFKADIDRNDPRTEQWSFLICNLLIHIRIGETDGRDMTSLTADLASLREARSVFPEYNDFQKAKREFTTNMLDALQRGAMGEFSSGGALLAKLLRDKPAGVPLGSVEGPLRILCEITKDPNAVAEGGEKMAAEFDKMYSAVRNLNIKKGNPDDDKPSKKLKPVQSKAPVNI